MDSFDSFQAFFEAAKVLFTTLQGGLTLTGLGGALMLLVRLFRSDFIQDFLPKQLQWANLPMGVKVAVPALGALVPALIAALMGGMAWPVALATALGAALSAIFANHTTKAAGAAADAVLAPKDAPYKPGVARTLAAPLFPIDTSKLPKFELVK